jgi:hypothetical protein
LEPVRVRLPDVLAAIKVTNPDGGCLKIETNKSEDEFATDAAQFS